MSLQRQRVDLKSFLESEIPREHLSAPLRARLESALASGHSLHEIAGEVVRELLQHGILREVGRLRRPEGSIRLWAVEGSPRAFDLQQLIGTPPPVSPPQPPSPGESPAPPASSRIPAPPASVRPPSATAAPEARPPGPVAGSTGGGPSTPAAEQETAPGGGAAPGSGQGLPPRLSEGARRTLEAIRSTFQRDWVSFGLDASLENLMIALRESLGDGTLHLVLWGERLPLQSSGGGGWELVDRSHPLTSALMRTPGAVLPAHGMVVEGRRWWPVWMGDQQVGALGGALTMESRLGDEAAGAVRDLIAAAARSQQRVSTDPLTGVYNRGYFDTQLAVEIERSRRTGAPLALLFADIDHFKQTNDDWGHDVGDTVLRHLSSLLVAHLRRIDYVFRYGGEEFALLLPGTDVSEAEHTAERLRSEIAATPLRLPDGRELGVTLSIGVAVFPDHGEDERVLLRRADLAMYQAKKAGRNRVVVWGRNGS